MVRTFALFILTILIQHVESQVLPYVIEKSIIPEEVILEVGGLAFNEDGVLGITTRRGEFWLSENPFDQNPDFIKIASGLHEPLGLAYHNNTWITTQRGELTRLIDKNGDKIIDKFEKVAQWPLEGNYHEYSYGPKFLPNGNMMLTLNLGWIGKGASLSKWRGWMIQVTHEGKIIPFATGMRSPAGFGTNCSGDIFFAENQGDWVGSGRITHLEEGDFAGHPAGLKWTSELNSPLKLKPEDITDTAELSLYNYKSIHPNVKPPSVWFPHTLMGISTSDIVCIDNDEFGPFEGQLLVGDQGHSKIMRVFQEKVNGVYQGICFPFVDQFSSGILRMIWGKDHKLYVGSTSRGWASTGKDPFALERLSYKGPLPFEMHSVQIQPDGFEIFFTKEVSSKTARDLSSYSVVDFTYLYRQIYGSPVVHQATKKVVKAEIKNEGKSVRIYVANLRPGFINEIKLEGIRSKNGEKLRHNFGYYTINEIPDGEKLSATQINADLTSTIEISTTKRVTMIPDSWDNTWDKEIVVGTLPGMKFDVATISANANDRIKLVLKNPDDMMHNLVIVNPGKTKKVGDLALQLGLKGQEKAYIPISDDVLFHTTLLAPESEDIIYFTAPSTPGIYEFVCTFPGHAMMMNGKFIIK